MVSSTWVVVVVPGQAELSERERERTGEADNAIAATDAMRSFILSSLLPRAGNACNFQRECFVA